LAFIFTASVLLNAPNSSFSSTSGMVGGPNSKLEYRRWEAEEAAK
jgi:hypothetical protein